VARQSLTSSGESAFRASIGSPDRPSSQHLDADPHTETIRKGKIAKPNEFGKLVTIQESEHQIITAYVVRLTRPADVTLWIATR
jgi:hypothetical protein